VARQAGLDHQAHARAAGRSACKLDAQLADPKSERKPDEFTPEPTPQRAPLHQARSPRGRGHLPHLGCSPSDKFTPGPQPSLPDDWKGGFLCPCHGSTFDMAGRVFKNKPAPDNLEVPPHMYLSDTRCSSVKTRRPEGGHHGPRIQGNLPQRLGGRQAHQLVRKPFSNGVRRLPRHMSEYYAPKNFNFWYIFGSLALLVLVIQIVTGIFLVMHYKPDAAKAFASVEYIMRDVPWGWLIRYMHSTGASAFFIVVYLHMFRGLIYGSYRKPRELVWIFGCAIFLALMAEAFMGYLLPWGQMSYWGAQVIVNLFAAIPVVGPDLALLIRGDYVVGDATLNRFFSFHVIAVPLVLLGLVVAHLLALHDVGSNNPDGVEIKGPMQPKDAKGIRWTACPSTPTTRCMTSLVSACS
jgi:hypothetical protein